MSDEYGGQRPTGDREAGESGASAPQYQQPYPPQPYQPYGQVYGVPPAGATPPGQYPFGQQPYGGYAPHLYAQPGFGPPGYLLRDPDRRPGTVLAAGIVTLVLSGLVLLFLGVMLTALVAARSEFIDGFSDESGIGGSDDSSMFAGILFVLVVLVLWAAAAIALAILTLRRVNWARITLVVSSSVTVVVSLLTITSGITLLTLLGAVAVIVLLFTGGAGDWYRGRKDAEPVIAAY